VKARPSAANATPTEPNPAATREDEAKLLTGAARDEAFQSLQPATQRAYLAFEYAESKGGRRLEDREAYDWLAENGITADQGNLGLLVDYTLPGFDTWTRQLREARKTLGEQKYKRRGRARTTRSIVTGTQIENQKGDGE
jgi:hypothetical protein